MVKNLINRIRHNHLLVMLLGCALPLVAVAGLLKLFSVNGDYLFWIFILLCPLAHVWMMRGHCHDKYRHEKHAVENKNNRDT